MRVRGGTRNLGQLRRSRLRLQIRVEIQVEVEEWLLLGRPEVWPVRVRAGVRRVLDGGRHGRWCCGDATEKE